MMFQETYYNDGGKLRLLTTIIISFLGMIWGAFLITNGTFNFFGISEFGMVFNYYILSILDGRLDVPPAIIGDEAFYGDNGQAYVYYGVLPAILRLPLVPFMDLTTTGLSRIYVFLATTGMAFICQSTVSTLLRKTRSESTFLVSTTSSILIWFASPVAILYANGSIYHEPIALGLLGLVTFFAMVINDVVVHGRNRPSSPIILSMIAGLMVHCRPTLAVPLYFCVSLFSLLFAFDEFKRQRQMGTGFLSSILKGILTPRTVLIPMLVLFFWGCTMLFMNWVRWDNIFTTAPKERYGFYLNQEGESARMKGFFEKGRFNINRIIPNTILHLTGFGKRHGYSVYIKLMEMFDTGFMRLENPSPMLLMWPIWLCAPLVALWGWLKSIRNGEKKSILLSIVTIAFIMQTVLMLSYATITVRYKSELWPILYLSYCYCIVYMSSKLSKTKGRILIFGSLISAVVCTLHAAYYRLAWVSKAEDTHMYESMLPPVNLNFFIW